MHNRLRMLTAMFLTKHLLIDWRQGERHFMDLLVDGDFAANNGGWQWSASTGTDAAPYFRIFNPVTQAKKFDPDGAFVRRWVPELATHPEAATASNRGGDGVSRLSGADRRPRAAAREQQRDAHGERGQSASFRKHSDPVISYRRPTVRHANC